jgi:hypothetical protein
MNFTDGKGFWKNVALVLTGILIGCGGAGGARALADYPPTAPKWQHMCLGPSGSVSGINDDVKKGGDEGWELVTATGGIVCFKRPR